MYKFQMYTKLQKEKPEIFAELKKAADEIGIPADVRGKFGLTGAISGMPSPLKARIEKAMMEESQKCVGLGYYVDQVRAIVKDVYGDEYDAAVTNTCEGSLWISFDSLFTPPALGRGDNYRGRYITPYEKHFHHHGAYGRPYPARYKDIICDRGVTTGELGFYGKRQNNLDTVIVPLVGAEYPVHGLKYYPVPFLTGVNVEKSLQAIEENAERHSIMLTGFSSLGYDTPGYGYADKDAEGTPLLSKGIAKIAKKYNVPYVIDNAWGIPFIGTNIKKIGADVVCYSLDKASWAPTGSLIIGTEESMVPIRRAMGLHSSRSGATSAYGKAAYVGFDPGKEALSGIVAALTMIRDEPQILKKPVDDLYDLVKEEFATIDSKIRNHFDIFKSYNSGAVEINYEKSWKNGQLGIPVFSIEDMYANSHLIQDGCGAMGIVPTIAYDGNIFVSAGLGTCDSQGNLDKDLMRKGIKGLMVVIETVCRHAGII
ncbi:MAG: hypothetical protein KBA26_13645 [Candidatus Delongbacteria bacterium]|nr:hypothetical protein [Candidatus Delongbacteria bacterium]